MPFEPFDRRTSTATPDIDLDQAGDIAGRALAIPYFWVKGSAQFTQDLVSGIILGPVREAQRIQAEGDRAPSQMQIDVGRSALIAGPGAMLPGFGRAAGGVAAGAELGISGSRLLARPDAIKLMRELHADGKSYQEITAALRDRFNPIIDAHAPLNKRMVEKRGETTGGTFELGAMGGQGRSSAVDGPITVEAVEEWGRNTGLDVRRVEKWKKGEEIGADYLQVVDPRNPPRTARETPTVRIPVDGHIGRAGKGGEIGNRYDTGHIADLRKGERQEVMRLDPRVTTNQAGEPLSEWANLESVLRWRFATAPDGQFLVPYGKAPHARQPTPPAEPTIKPDPRQLKLLSGGVPIPSDGGWQTTVEREPDAGRFARPVYMSDDAQLVRDTRGLRFEIMSAADDAESLAGTQKHGGRLESEKLRITEGQWGTFIDLLKQIDKVGTYTPGERESTNVQMQ